MFGDKIRTFDPFFVPYSHDNSALVINMMELLDTFVTKGYSWNSQVSRFYDQY